MSAAAWVAFCLAAAAGAVLRYVVDGAVANRLPGALPWGTLVINASGSFVLGLLTGLVLYHAFPGSAKVVLGTGFCGAYTTFSTFTYETVVLAERGDRTRALAYALGTLLLCAGAAALGIAAAAL